MEKKESDGPNMFYGAAPILFERARVLRRNETMAEKLLWASLSKKQLGVKFRRQHPIDQFIADFYCHAQKLVIEVDGGIHKSREVRENDRLRDKQMLALNLRILRFSNAQVLNELEKVLSVISAEVKRK